MFYDVGTLRRCGATITAVGNPSQSGYVAFTLKALFKTRYEHFQRQT